MLKSELRAMVRQRWHAVTADERLVRSAMLAERIRRHGVYGRAATVMLYHPLPDEADLTALLSDHACKTLLLPLVTGPATMEARLYTGPDSLRRGAFGIMEPTGEPFANLAAVDMVVVPGVAFDACGHRLGRGRGYYDRFLPMLPRAYRLGVCLAHQLVDNVPTDPLDIPMHEVMCEDSK